MSTFDQKRAKQEAERNREQHAKELDRIHRALLGRGFVLPQDVARDVLRLAGVREHRIAAKRLEQLRRQGRARAEMRRTDNGHLARYFEAVP